MISVPIGHTAPLTFTDALGNPVTVIGAVFAVSPTTVGSVSGSVFTALALGSALITATLPTGSVVTATLLVVDPPTLTLVVGTPS